MLNLPNILTILRLALLPPMVALFFLPFEWAVWTTFTLYVIGTVTDFLDGWIARRFNATSEFGAMMDPIADKMFVVTIMLMLVATGRLEGLIIMGVIIIILREFMVSGLREFLGNKDVKLPVSTLAKWKTASQMFALGFLIIGPYLPLALLTGQILLITAAALTVVTGWGYLKTGLDYIKKIP